MAVIVKFASDKDPTTMFDNRAEAEAYDARLEQEENLAELLEQAAMDAGVALPTESAHQLATALVEKHGDRLLDIVRGKKPRQTPPRKPAATPTN
jgi:dsDNA-binding SOS-regulon protein